MKRISPTTIEIDFEALRHNFRQLRKKCSPGTKSLCVVKSNAYGHGAGRVARILQEEGADCFGVGTIDEGVELRESRIKRPILLLLGILDDHRLLLRYQLTPVIYSIDVAKKLNAALLRSKNRLDIHLKVDTGMTRLGILPHEVKGFCETLKTLGKLKPVGLLTHLADAGKKDYTKKQIKQFEECRTIFEKHFRGTFHIANSQAVIEQSSRSDSQGDHGMVRFGIALYGAYPAEKDRELIDLKPVLHWKSQFVFIKKVPPRTSISYGRTFTTKKESCIGVIPVGYADGYPRSLSNRSEVLVKGKRVPVVGTICMDMMMVDLTSVPNTKVGEEVVLIGKQGHSEIQVGELAVKAKTISYEILCQIATRIPRAFK